MVFFCGRPPVIWEEQMKITLFVFASLLCLLSGGCGRNSEIESLAFGQDVWMEGHVMDYEGEADFEVTGAYVTDSPAAEGVDLERIDAFASIMQENGDGGVSEYRRDEFLNGGHSMSRGARMYVLHIKARNVDARYRHYKEGGYETPYVFRADNLFLNFIDKKGRAVKSQVIDYYSRRPQDDGFWSSFELEPGETVEYDIGYIVGDVYREGGVTYRLDECTPCISCSMGGLEQSAPQYRVAWEEAGV